MLTPDPAANGGRAQLLGAAFLAGVLVTAVAVDLGGAAPSWGQDALYAVMAVALAAVAWGARAAP